MDSKMDLIVRLRAGAPVAQVCRELGISRECAYKWWRRYKAEGVDGLTERSRAPKEHPNAVAPALREAILELREKHPTWGPRKLLGCLQKQRPRAPWPVASTVGELLKSHGLVAPQRPRRRAVPSGESCVNAPTPNACWSIDFKGQFRLGDGVSCYPLTLQDACSRYLLRCHGLRSTSEQRVRPVLESAFREYGLPDAIRSDNGSPFASASLTGLTRDRAGAPRAERSSRADAPHAEARSRFSAFA